MGCESVIARDEETFFGPLIEEVENKIKQQQGRQWDRDLFENHLMGYTIRTEYYRLVAWLDYRNVHAEPYMLNYMTIEKIRMKRKMLPKNFLPRSRNCLKKLRASGIGKRE